MPENQHINLTHGLTQAPGNRVKKPPEVGGDKGGAAEQERPSLFPIPSAVSSRWLIGVWLALGLPTLIYPIARDQGVFAYIGGRLFDGAVLYVDLWDVKSPLVYWIYGLAMQVLGADILSVRILDLLNTGLSAYLVYAVVSQMSGKNNGENKRRAGTVSALIYLLWYYLPSDYRVLGNCETFITPFMLVGLLGVLRISTGKHSAAGSSTNLKLIAFLSGLALGLTLLIKTTAIVFLFPAALALIVFPRETSFGGRLQSVFCLGLGFSLAVGLGWTYLMATGATEEWLFLNLSYLPTYTRLSHQLGAWTSFKVSLYFFKGVSLLYPALALGVILYLRCLFRRKILGATGAANFRALWIVFGFGLIYTLVIIAQGKYLNYHFLPFLAPFAIVTGVITMSVFENPRSRSWLKLSCLLVFLLSGAYIWRLPERYSDTFRVITDSGYQEKYYAKLSTGNYPCLVSHQIGAYLQKNSATGDRLFIWSFEPEIYFLAKMEPASRFLFNTPLLIGDLAADWKVELLEDLQKNSPEYIVVGVDDGLPLITGENYSSAERLDDVPGLEQFIKTHYQQVEEIGGFLLLKRRVFAGIIPEKPSA